MRYLRLHAAIGTNQLRHLAILDILGTYRRDGNKRKMPDLNS